MFDAVGVAVGKIHGDRGEQKAIQGSTKPGTSCQKKAHSAVHQNQVPKRVADSHIAVIGHEAQQEQLWSNHGHIEEDLNATGHERNGLLFRNHVDQEFWDSGTNEKGVHDGQLAEQKVHGCMEATVHVNQEYHDQICSYSNHKNNQNNCKDNPYSFTV